MSLLSTPPKPVPQGPQRSTSSQEAWIESSQGGKFALDSACSFGRLGTNHIAVDDEKASRRHATIERQGRNEFWLIDLGSRNGTYLNGRRLSKVTRLFDRDQIQIGASIFTFHQPCAQRDQVRDHTLTSSTLQHTKTQPCWLLVIDLESSTEFARNLAPEKLPSVMGRWLDQCRDMIERHDGSIDKYLGDGMLGYWVDGKDVAEKVARALAELKAFQESSSPPFRLALHYGDVTIGGVASWVQESLMGPQINFIFRMEKLGGQLGISRLVSQPAQQHLRLHLTLIEAGNHPVRGFEKEYLFYEF